MKISMMVSGTIKIIIWMKKIEKEKKKKDPELCLIGVTLSQSRVSEKAITIMTKTITQDKEDVPNCVWCDQVAGLAWRMSSTKAIHPGVDTKYFGPICYKISWTIIPQIAQHKTL